MAIELTASGWLNELGFEQFWSEASDFAYGSSTNITSAIFVRNDVVVATLGGNDYISGVALGNGIGLEIQGELQTNQGSDLVIGYSAAGVAGIDISGTLGTGQDSDKIIGQAIAGNGINVSFGGAMLTKAGADVIVGNSVFAIGITNQGTIQMDVSGVDEASDVLQAGGGTNGLFNSGSITFGGGNDTLIAVSTTGNGIDLINSGEIRMGSGADTLVCGGTNLVDGGGNIFLGAGGDTFRGFGNMTVDAGDGVRDTLILPTESVFEAGFELSYTVNLDGDNVTFTASVDNTAVTMTTTGFETLSYGNQTFAFSELFDGQTLTAPA